MLVLRETAAKQAGSHSLLLQHKHFPLFRRNQILLLQTKSGSQMPYFVSGPQIAESCAKLVLALAEAHWYPKFEESHVISPTSLCMLAALHCSSFCRRALREGAFVWDQAAEWK